MRNGAARLVGIVGALLIAACDAAGVRAIPIQTGTPCAFCRMTIADPHLAAELVAPGEEPREYDDIGCLVNDLRRQPPPAGSRAFVADYRSDELLSANDAMYTRVPALQTPMGFHLVAHRDEVSRSADVRVRDGQRLDARDVFGASGAPGGSGGR